MDKREIDAKKFWHEHVGQYLQSSNSDWETSLGAAYPCLSAKGVKRLRIGSLAPAAIMIDENGAIVIERLSVDDLPKMPSTINIVNNFDSKEYSLTRTVFDWVCDEKRTYPFLAIIPTKRSLSDFMELSVMPSCVVVAEPGKVLAFDVIKLRETKNALIELDAVSKWRMASSIREQMKKPDFDATPKEKNDLMTKYIKSLDDIPEHLWLPSPNTVEYDALGSMLIEKHGMSF